MSDGRVASASGSRSVPRTLGTGEHVGSPQQSTSASWTRGKCRPPRAGGNGGLPGCGYPTGCSRLPTRRSLNQPGLLRQQITTDPARQRSPAGFVHRFRTPRPTGSNSTDRLHGPERAAAEHCVASSLLHRTSESWRHGWSAQGIRRPTRRAPSYSWIRSRPTTVAAARSTSGRTQPRRPSSYNSLISRRLDHHPAPPGRSSSRRHSVTLKSVPANPPRPSRLTAGASPTPSSCGGFRRMTKRRSINARGPRPRSRPTRSSSSPTTKVTEGRDRGGSDARLPTPPGYQDALDRGGGGR